MSFICYIVGSLVLLVDALAQGNLALASASVLFLIGSFLGLCNY